MKILLATVASFVLLITTGYRRVLRKLRYAIVFPVVLPISIALAAGPEPPFAVYGTKSPHSVNQKLPPPVQVSGFAVGHKPEWLVVSDTCNAMYGITSEKSFEAATSRQRGDAMHCMDYHAAHHRYPTLAQNDTFADADTDWILTFCVNTSDYDRCRDWARSIKLTGAQAKKLAASYGIKRF